jgi:hypothetical protein
MRVAGIVLLIAAASCRRPYQHAGDPAPLEVAGQYGMAETLYSNDCPPSVARALGVELRKQKIHVEVQNTAPSTLLRLTVDVEPFDAQMLPNGRFEVKPIETRRGNASIRRGISGRFTSTGFSARYVVETQEPLPQVRPGPVEYRICKYNFLWEASKL